jgi:phosphoenolpyruvate phosphomutase
MKRLRRLIASKPIVRILESHSGLTGLIAENACVEVNNVKREFDGMWASSLTDSTSKGKPDIEAVDLTTRLHGLNDALEVTTKPFIYDGDTGGKLEHFVFTVRTLERLGVSAVIIEDKVGLKQNSLFGTDAVQTQDTIEGFSAKIKAGKRAQITDDFMIIARCESLIAGKPISDAIERCVAYVEAGVDGIMIHSKEKTGEDIMSMLKILARPFKLNSMCVILDNIAREYSYEECEEVGSYLSPYGNRDMFPKTCFNKYICKTFEKESFLVAEGYETNLKNIYGDYMTPPSKDKRKSEHNAKFYKR